MENAKHRIRRLSAQFNYHGVFEYMVDWRKTANVSGVLPFHYARKWCNETWGFGTDVDSHVVAMLAGEQVNPHWAYCAQYDQYRIYFTSDAELVWFKLKFGSEKNA
jgi:hypothetical protein